MHRHFIVLKFDDFVPSGSEEIFSACFRRVSDHAEANDLHASFGVIAKALEKEDGPFCAWVRSNARENGGRFEFWHHGYDHKLHFKLDGVEMQGEFSGPTYAYQSAHFKQAMALFTKRTGLVFHTFGAPGNAHDGSTLRVLEEEPQIKVWLYGDTHAVTTKLVLDRPLNLECAVGVVNVEEFEKEYAGVRTHECLVLQGHPAMWSDESWNAYLDIVNMLKEDRREFITPMEWFVHQASRRKQS